MRVELHAVQHIPHEDIIPFSYDNNKTCFQNSNYSSGNLLWRMELFELQKLQSGDLDFKAHTSFWWFYQFVSLSCLTSIYTEA